MNDIPFVTFTSDPIEGEVSQALSLYKIALIKTNYRNFCKRRLSTVWQILIFLRG